MYRVGPPFPPGSVYCSHEYTTVTVAQTAKIHNEAWAKLCRVCGQLLKAAGRSTYCTKNSHSLLKSVFGIEIEHDDPLERYCHCCCDVTYYTANCTSVAEWSLLVHYIRKHSEILCNNTQNLCNMQNSSLCL